MSNRLPPVPKGFQQHLSPLPSGWQTINYAVFSDETLAVVSANVDLVSEHQRIKLALLSSSRLDPPSCLDVLSSGGTMQVWTACSSSWVMALMCPLERPYPIVNRLNDGRWLVAESGFYSGTNARLLSRNGVLLSRLKLGDGIRYMATDAFNRIWVGWNDQGIGGNSDWDIDGHEYPPSLDGLGGFDVNGNLLPLPDWPFPPGFLIECYALNVTETRAC